MATNSTVIGDALRELGVISEVQTPSAEQGLHGLRKLNEMIETWRETAGVNIGYFAQTSTTADCPIPKWCEKGVKAGLAIELAPTYGASVSAELAKKYEDGYGAILRRVTVDKLTGADMSHMAPGTGYGRVIDITNG